MGEIAITLDGHQVDVVRRAVAQEAENTAQTIASHVGTIVDGHFREEPARHNREALDYCVESLHSELAILRQLPWSMERAVNLDLADSADEVRRILEQADGGEGD